MEKKIDPSFNKKITDQLLDPYNYITSRKIINYREGDIQTSEYQSVNDEDEEFTNFIIKKYGSFDEYLKQKRITKTARIFDPLSDFIIDVSIVKPDVVYKTDHISSYEVIMENLTGVCSVWFLFVCFEPLSSLGLTKANKLHFVLKSTISELFEIQASAVKQNFQGPSRALA